MNNKKSNVLKYLSLILIAMLAIPVLAFALGTDKGVSSGWATQSAQLTTASLSGESVIVEKEGSVQKLYLHIGNVYYAPNGKLDITIDWSDSSSSIQGSDYIGIQRKQVTVDLPEDGFYNWVCIADDLAIGAKYVKVTVLQSIDINEIALVDKDGKQVVASCYGAIVWKNAKRSFVSAQNAGDLKFTAVTDEQDSFIQKGVFSQTDAENKLSGAISNLLKGEGYYVSQTENVLAVELISLGAIIFGNNSFGLAIIPYIFFVACAYVIFFFASKLFGSHGYGLAAAILFMLAGLPLGIAVNAGGRVIALFFLLSAFYFAYSYYNQQLTVKNLSSGMKKLLLCGITFALAVCADIYCSLAFIALAVLCSITSAKAIIKTSTDYSTAEGLEKEYARERHVKVYRAVVLYSLVSFIIIPILFVMLTYAIVYPVYMGYYGDLNFFAMIAENHYNLAYGANGSLYLGWIVGLFSQKLTSTIGNESYLVANKGLVLLSLVSLIAVAVIYILFKAGKIKNEKLLAELIENQKVILALLISFAVNFFMLTVFIGSASYSSFVFSLVFLTMFTLMLHKLLKQMLGKRLMLSVTAVAAVIIVFFFVLQLPLFLNIPFKTEISNFYMWLI
ncbi:MAG: hypothetical protein IJW13_06295 [Clostridia bacterium]|nr:hypothetical protein [Clostridia bacterium]